MCLVLYGAIAITIITAWKIAQAWGAKAGLVFAALNALVIFLFPAGKIIGLVAAGTLFYLMRDTNTDGDSPDPPAS